MPVLPGGRTPPHEGGYFAGAGNKPAFLHEPAPVGDPELMYRMAGLITPSLDEVVRFLG